MRIGDLYTRYWPGPEGARPIVRVHGLGSSGAYMVPTAKRLAPRAAVYVPDLPGFGRSGRPRRVLGIGELAAALAAWTEAAGLERASFVGNSLGCQVLVELALRRPELVERLILVGPTVDAGARSFVRQLARLACDSVREPVGLVGIVVRDYLWAGPRRVVATGLHALRDPVEEKLPDVRAPTLVVRGSRDCLASQPWAERVAALLPAGRLLVIPASAHAVNYSAPDALAAAVTEFLGLV